MKGKELSNRDEGERLGKYDLVMLIGLIKLPNLFSPSRLTRNKSRYIFDA